MKLLVFAFNAQLGAFSGRKTARGSHNGMWQSPRGRGGFRLRQLQAEEINLKQDGSREARSLPKRSLP